MNIILTKVIIQETADIDIQADTKKLHQSLVDKDIIL